MFPSEQTPEPTAPALPDLASSIVAEVTKPENLEKLRRHAQNVNLEARKDATELGWSVLQTLVEKAARILIDATGGPAGLMDPLAKAAIDSLLEGNVGSGSVPGEAGARLIERIAGPATSIEPGTEGAARYITLLLHEQVEAWIRSVTIELVTEFMPRLVGVGGGIETVQGLQDIVEAALGGGRMVRRVLQPFVQATAITPAQWHANKKYRPELLPPAQAVRALSRGEFTTDEVKEELARQGWDERRISSLIADGQKGLSASEALALERLDQRLEAETLDWLKRADYDPSVGHQLRILDALERDERNGEQIAGLAITAYAARDIGRAEFTSIVRAALRDQRHAARLIDLGEARRGLSRHGLSAGEARRLALSRILSVADYRRALEREGYDDMAIAALELELMAELQDRRDLEAARAAQAEERAREKEQRDQERAERQRALETARGRAYATLAEARRLYVRGLIPIDGYRQMLELERLPNLDVAALLADAEAERVDYAEALERRRQAEAREVDPVVPLAKVEEAVMRGILSLVDYGRELAARGFDAGEQLTLYNLLADRLEDQAEARRHREEAEARAAAQSVSLATFERAVRLGVRTTAQYAAFLESIGTTAPARALILDLLEEQLRRDAEAEAARDAAAERAGRRGISLEQRARAVVRGIRPIEYYAAALLETDVPIDEQQVLVELLEAEALAAAEARARRDELADQVGDAELPLSTIERAVKLGALPPAELRERAIAKGLRAEDAELLVQLVVADVPVTREAQQRERTIVQELASRNRSLADEKTLVTRGIRSLEQYGEQLAAWGYGTDDVALLVQLLEEEIGADLDGLRKRIGAALEKADGAPAIAEFSAALAAGELDVPQLVDALASWGIARDQALVFGRLLLVIEPLG